jgi:hypothetical protein
MPAVAPSIVHDVIESPGSPLDRATRSSFEPRFGRDLSDVRVHADDRAAASARAVGAVAYTVGSHIVFEAGSLAPGTAEGRRLLAHELTHVVQWPGTAVPSRGALQIGGADSPLEQEATAEAAGSREVVRQRPFGGVVTVQRQTAHPLPGGVPPASMASCGWTGASDVSNELSRRDTLIGQTLPGISIVSDADLHGFLQRWLQSTACIEIAQPQWFPNDKTLVPRARAQYVTAVKLILLHAETALGQRMADLVARNVQWIRPDALTEIQRYSRLDRFERLDPGHPATPGSPASPNNNPQLVLDSLNPGAFGRYCTQNCPAAAADVQNYLRTGDLQSSHCTPLSEPRGYIIDPDPDTAWGPSRGWAATWPLVMARTASHGQFVLIEGDRGPTGHPGLTQWHYFVILNIHGTRFSVDGYLRTVSADIGAYVQSLRALTYRIAPGAIKATPAP